MLPAPDSRPFEMIRRAADKAEGACAEPDGPILADRACIREKTLGNFALVIDPLTPDDTGQVAFERFEQAPDCPVLAVVDEDRHPIGMIERNAFLLSMGGNFGRAVYAQRSVTLLMTQVTLLGEARVDAGDFAEMALRQYSHDLLRGFIIVNDGCYLGVGGIIDLLRATTQERTDNASQLHKMAKDLRRSNRALERQRLLAEAVIEHIPSLIAVRRQSDGNVRLINGTGAAMLGVTREELVGRKVEDMVSSGLARQIQRTDAILAHHGSVEPLDVRFMVHGSKRRILRVMNIPILMPHDEENLNLTIAEDVTEVREATSRIQELAHFDILTGLPNRIQLNNRLNEMLHETPGSAPREVAVIAIDLDRFKMVNDTFGHHAGDAVLREMAKRLRATLRQGDLPVRLGGDEFAVVIEAPQVAGLAEKISDRLIETLKEPFQFGDKVVHLGGSIGIAVYPGDCTQAEDLIKYADLALYRAKADGKGRWRRFSPEMREGLEQRNAMEVDLRSAMDKRQLEVHLQPQLEIATNRITGFECLMRWNHPTRGYVPPAVFIPMAEDIGLIDQMGEWILNEACRIGTSLPSDISLAVNISAVQFRVTGLADRVRAALETSGLEPKRLELEITESVLIHDEEQVMDCIRQLRTLGVRIALDDFGTGFASFAYLQRYAFDKIKIDRSFVQGLPHDPSSRAIVSAVTVLGSQLGTTITAEGVETQIQFDALRQLGCVQVQGYLIGRPTSNPQAYLEQRQPLGKVA